MNDDEVKKILSDIKAKVDKRPYLKYELGDRHILVQKPSEDGFDVGFYVDKREFTVTMDGWHDHFAFEELDRALNYFTSGFFKECRLKVVSRRNKDYKWTLEFQKDGEWTESSTMGHLIVPLFGKKRVRYLQNDIPEKGKNGGSV